jgi:hypothetical protein
MSKLTDARTRINPWAHMSSPQQKPIASKGSLVADRRSPLNVLFGLPDDGKALVCVADDGKRLDFTLTGTASLVSYVSRQRFAMNTLYLHPEQRIPVQLGPDRCSTMSGCRYCSGALELIEQIVSKVHDPASTLRQPSPAPRGIRSLAFSPEYPD